MDKFVRLTATICPLSLPNLNTDQILPARYLKWPRSKGLGSVLFDDVRLDAKGQLREDFAFNKDAYRGAKVLLAGRNFGGGSSREAAVYALYDHGFRCVVAPSFGDIFSQNAVKNGLLTALAEEADIELAVVKSPIVGTFYRAPEPGAPPFVEVGSTVKKGQVLCIIEAMKLMNEIDSEYDGEVVNVYVESGQPVQYGERLFAIRAR